jgi:tetratricopeptide (TPR) repeat protein
MSEQREQCLAPDEIVAYVNGALSGKPKSEIDCHLAECRLCEAAVEGVARWDSKPGYLSSAESILTRIRLRSATSSRPARSAARQTASPLRYARRYFALAAGIIVCVGVTVFLARPGANEVLFRAHFEPYPSPQPIVRGDGVSNARSNTLALYEARDYRGALAGFQQWLNGRPTDPLPRFYSGLCRLALGESAQAVTDFEQVRKLGSNALEAPTDWYLALAYLRSGNVPEARSQLQRIVDRGGFYQEQARILVSELEGRGFGRQIGVLERR